MYHIYRCKRLTVGAPSQTSSPLDGALQELEVMSYSFSRHSVTTPRHGSSRHGSSRHGSSWHGSSRHGSSRHGSASSSTHGSSHGSSRHGETNGPVTRYYQPRVHAASLLCLQVWAFSEVRGFIPPLGEGARNLRLLFLGMVTALTIALVLSYPIGAFVRWVDPFISLSLYYLSMISGKIILLNVLKLFMVIT